MLDFSFLLLKMLNLFNKHLLNLLDASICTRPGDMKKETHQKKCHSQCSNTCRAAERALRGQTDVRYTPALRASLLVTLLLHRPFSLCLWRFLLIFPTLKQGRAPGCSLLVLHVLILKRSPEALDITCVGFPLSFEPRDIYFSNPDLFSEPQTHVSNCLSANSSWKSASDVTPAGSQTEPSPSCLNPPLPS